MENNTSKINLLIDRLPSDFKGYLIKSDFRTGILINRCLNDNSFKSDEEKVYTVSRILFGKGIPHDFKTALEGINWFMSGGKISNISNHSKPLISFELDDSMIFSAFMTKFSIDLTQSHMHFFKFLALMGELRKTTLSDIVNVRSMSQKDLKRYSQEDRRKIRQLQSDFSLNQNNLSDQDLENIRKFDERFLNA